MFALFLHGCGVWFTPDPSAAPVAEAPVAEAPPPDPVRVRIDEAARSDIERRLAEIVCSDAEPADCGRYVVTAAWLELGELAVDAAVARSGATGERWNCTTSVVDCLAAHVGPGAAVAVGTDVTWLAPTGEGDRVARVWARAVGPWSGFTGGPTPLRVVHRDVVTDAALARAIPNVARPGVFSAPEGFEVTGDFVMPRFEVPAASARTLRWPRRLFDEALVVCPDRIERLSDESLAAVELDTNNLTGSLLPTYHYALPCEARLVLRGVPGVKPGPRPAPHRASPPAELGGVEPSEEPVRIDVGPFTVEGVPVAHRRGGFDPVRITAGAQELLKAGRGGTLPFVGDLDGDGIEDAVTYRNGEMGCDGRELWMSQPDGSYARVVATGNPC